MNSQLKVCIVGLGYIGLPTAAVIASKKIQVVGLDKDQKVVKSINNGKSHITEPGLETKVKSAVNLGYLKATTTSEHANVYLITVPTPFKANVRGHPAPDLSFVEAAAKNIAAVLKKGDLVIIESTCPVGSTKKIAQLMNNIRPDLTFPSVANGKSDIQLAYCPERMIPGKALKELVNNDRVIGGLSAECSKAAAEFYRLFITGECFVSDAEHAELCKLVENAYRDVNIAFANELSNVCEELSLNVWNIIELSNKHPRVNILKPGPGVGGHCIAVDPWFIVDAVPNSSPLIKCSRKVNDSMPERVFKKIKKNVESLRRTKELSFKNSIVIACFGMSFKADVDDLRSSPALEVIEKIANWHTGELLIVEPNIDALHGKLANKATLVQADKALETANFAVLLVDHDEFRGLKDAALKSFDAILDVRGLWL